MGRRVKTEGEALEEARMGAEQNGLEDKVQVEPVSPGPLPKSGMPLTAEGYYDYFRFSELKTENGISTLTNLELPCGTWSELKLVPFEQGRFTQSEFFGLSDGSKMVLGNGVYSNPSGPITQPHHILPLRVQYWFLRAAYEKFVESRASYVDPLIKNFQSKLQLGYHFAEKIEWLRSGGYSRYAIIEFGGWPKSHPLNIQTATGAVPANMKGITLSLETECLPMLTMSLFDDPDPIRVQNVLGFAIGNPVSPITLQIEPANLRHYGALLCPNGPVLNLTGNPAESRYAQWLYAPEQNYTPRTVGK